MDKEPITISLDDEAHTRNVRLALLGIALLLCGGLSVFGVFQYRSKAISMYNRYFPSPTPTPSRTATPTATNTPTPTPNFTATAEAAQATDIALAYLATAEITSKNWKVIQSDTFDSNTNNWLVDSVDDEYSLTTYEILDGKYRWDVTAHKSVIGWVKADWKALADFYLSVDIQQTEGPNTTDYGLIFREDDNSNFYYFGIDEHGQYAVFLYFEEWHTLRDWTKTELIRPGKFNRLMVIGEGPHFIFFINGQYLAEITDDTIASGSTALAIEMVAENDHAVFEFDNFDLRAP